MSQFLLRRHNDDETSEICSNDVTTCEDLRYYRVIIIEGLKKTTKTLMIMVPLLWTCIMRVACGATELNVSVSQSVTLPTKSKTQVCIVQTEQKQVSPVWASNCCEFCRICHSLFNSMDKEFKNIYLLK